MELRFCCSSPGWAVDAVESIFRKQRQAFELFGFDLMLDADCKPYLIEVRTEGRDKLH